jgi:prevent-host-death family protein
MMPPAEITSAALEQKVNTGKNRKHDSNPDPITGKPGAHPVGVAGGALAGAAVGAMVGGPIGSAIGGAIGAVAGGLVGKGVAESVNSTEEDRDGRKQDTSRPYFQNGRKYEVQQTLENTDENLAKVVESNDRVVLTRGGDPIAVVLSIEEYRSMEATVGLLRDPDNLRRALGAEERLKGTA